MLSLIVSCSAMPCPVDIPERPVVLILFFFLKENRGGVDLEESGNTVEGKLFWGCNVRDESKLKMFV